jgi:uncharacterized protein (DUF779 family)
MTMGAKISTYALTSCFLRSAIVSSSVGSAAAEDLLCVPRRRIVGKNDLRLGVGLGVGFWVAAESSDEGG